MVKHALTVLMALASLPSTLWGQATNASGDEAIIRQSVEAYVQAFNKNDAKAVAGFWTETGDYTDDSGRTITGRDAIAREYADFFKANPGVKIRLAIDSLKLLSSTVAIEDGRAFLDPLPAGEFVCSKYTAIHVKADGKWLMSTVRDSRVELPSAYKNLADLEWFVGTWTAEEHGVKTVSRCRWIGNKSFLERRYTVTQPDGLTTTGLQVLGWNPVEAYVQSWTFSADGGHAIGNWTPEENGWRADMRGVTGDGRMTTATNLLRKLDNDAFVWRSVQRTAGGEALPDTDEVIMKRLPNEP